MDNLQNIIIEIEKLKANQEFTSAISLLEANIIKHSSDYRLYEELADIYLYKGELTKALKSVNFALRLHKESSTGNYLKGFILLSQDKIESAIMYLEKSNNLSSNNSEVLRNLGWAYHMRGDALKGITILQRAHNISPGDDLIAEDLAMALIGNGQIVEGNTLLQKIGKNIMS